MMFIANIQFYSCLGQLFAGKTTFDAPQPYFPRNCLRAEMVKLRQEMSSFRLYLVYSCPWGCRVFSDSVNPLLSVPMSSSPIMASLLLFALRPARTWLLCLSSIPPLLIFPVLLLSLSLFCPQLLVLHKKPVPLLEHLSDPVTTVACLNYHLADFLMGKPGSLWPPHCESVRWLQRHDPSASRPIPPSLPSEQSQAESTAPGDKKES